MRIERSRRRPFERGTLPKGFFFRVCDTRINLSSEVRDTILPHRYVYVEFENGNLILVPTDNADGYKATLRNGRQMCVTWAAADRVVKIPKDRRVYGFSATDGTAVFPLREKNKGGSM